LAGFITPRPSFREFSQRAEALLIDIADLLAWVGEVALEDRIVLATRSKSNQDCDRHTNACGS
jgi:hypothetical protein